MKIIITLLVAIIWIAGAPAITRSIKAGADQRLQSQEQIASAKNKQVKLLHEAQQDYEHYKQDLKEDREFRRLTGQPEPITVRVVK